MCVFSYLSSVVFPRNVCFPQATCDREQEASCGIQTFRSHQGAQHYRISRWQCRLAKCGPWKRISSRICFSPKETVHKNCFWNHQTTSVASRNTDVGQKLEVVERLDAPRLSSEKKNGHTCQSWMLAHLVYQWAWRQSIGSCSPAEFLEHLHELVQNPWAEEKFSVRSATSVRQWMNLGWWVLLIL